MKIRKIKFNKKAIVGSFVDWEPVLINCWEVDMPHCHCSECEVKREKEEKKEKKKKEKKKK